MPPYDEIQELKDRVLELNNFIGWLYDNDYIIEPPNDLWNQFIKDENN